MHALALSLDLLIQRTNKLITIADIRGRNSHICSVDRNSFPHQTLTSANSSACFSYQKLAPVLLIAIRSLRMTLEIVTFPEKKWICWGVG